MLLLKALLVAIAFGRWFAISGTGSPKVATGTINNGETSVVAVFMKPVTAAVTGISGGGTYTQRATKTQGTIKGELWSTNAGAATAASSVTVTMSGSPTQAGVAVHVSTGVTTLGNTNTGSGTGANPSISVTTQDNNNWVAAFFGFNDGGSLPTAGTGNLRGTDADASIIDGTTDNTRGTPGALVNSVTKGAVTDWASLALELRSALPASAALTGTVTSSITENDIVAGGKTIILTLTGTTWIP